MSDSTSAPLSAGAEGAALAALEREIEETRVKLAAAEAEMSKWKARRDAHLDALEALPPGPEEEKKRRDLEASERALAFAQAEVARLDAALRERRGAGESAAKRARAVHFEYGDEAFSDVLGSILSGITFPDPETVTLPRLSLADVSSNNEYARALVASGQYKVPGKRNAHLLLDGWDSDEAVPDAGDLYNASRESPVVLFGASGTGKTRLLTQLLKSHLGTFLVHKSQDGKNAGSRDLWLMGRAVTDAVDDSMSPETKRKIADFGIRCLLTVRVAFLAHWERVTNKRVSPRQWALAQLHPEVFFPVFAGRDGEPNSDVFAHASQAVFKRSKRDSVKVTFPQGYVTLVDEAQMLTSILAGELAALAGKRPVSVRALFSSVVSESNGLGGHYAVFSGTGLSMAQALAAAESGDLKRPSQSFGRFTPFRESDIAAYLARVVGVESSPQVVQKLLVGRPRTVTRFVDFLVERPDNPSLLAAMQEFAIWMTDPKSPGSRATLADIVAAFRNDPRAGPARLRIRDPRRPPPSHLHGAAPVEITCSSLFDAFQTAAFQASNAGVGLVDTATAKLLVEVGVLVDWTKHEPSTPYVPMGFEELLLRAASAAVFDDEFMRRYLVRASESPSPLGFAFERVVGHRLSAGLFNGITSFSSHPVIKGSGRKLPEWLRGATLTAFPSLFGSVAEPGNDMYKWFSRNLALARGDDAQRMCVLAKYPGRFAGPDYCQLVRRSKTAGDVTTVDVALVLVQVKLVAELAKRDLERAKATVDPALAYHVKRTTKPKLVKNRAEGHAAWLEALRDVPVVRIVFAPGAARERRQVVVESVKHGRRGSSFSSDALLVIRHPDDVRAVLGAPLEDAVIKLKNAMGDDLEELQEGEYDEATETM